MGLPPNTATIFTATTTKALCKKTNSYLPIAFKAGLGVLTTAHYIVVNGGIPSFTQIQVL